MPAPARVLLVEAPEPANSMGAALIEAAFDVRAEPEPLRACALLRREAFDAVVARLPRPDTDALALVRAARRHSPPAVMVFRFAEAGRDPAVLQEVSRAPETAVVAGDDPATTIDALRGLLRGDAPVEGAGAAGPGGPIHGLLASIEAVETARTGADLDVVRWQIASAALGMTGSRSAWLVAWEPGGRLLKTGDAAAPPGLAAEVRLARRPLVRHGRGEATSFIGVPVAVDDAVTAALLIEFESGVDASGGLPFAEALTRLAQLSEVNVRLRQRLERSPDALTTTLWTALALRGLDVEGHARRVAETALALGRAIGLDESPEAMRELRRAALLHDVGKLGLPDELLGGEPLTIAQRADLQRHPLLAERLLSGWDELAGAAGLVRSFRERWDGAGFPDGLAGDAIPIGSRLLAVADAWDGLNPTGNEALSALDHLRRDAAGRFDPDVVGALRMVVAERAASRVIDASGEELAVA